MTPEEIRKQVSVFTLRLQNQIDVPLWSLAHEDIIYFTSIGEKFIWGHKGAIIHFLMRHGRKLRITDFLLFSIGLYKAIILWSRVRKKIFKITTGSNPKRIFSGFGAASEEFLHAEYTKQSNLPSLRIHTVTCDGISVLGCPKLSQIVIELYKHAFGHTRKLKNAIDEVALNINEFLTLSAMNIGDYAFFRLFWRICKEKGVKEVDSLSLNTSTIACVDEGLNTIYTEHGLMMISMIIPQVKQLNVLTTSEESYFKKNLKNIRIINVSRSIDMYRKKNNVIVILSPNILISERMVEIETLLKWAVKMQLEIIFRPTQTVTKSESDILNKKYPMAIIDDYNSPFDVRIRLLNPKIIFAWSSTGLATALDYGILPVNLHEPSGVFESGSLNADVNTIYSLAHHVLFWSRDIDVIQKMMDSEVDYCTQIENLKKYQDLSLM
ncbi:MAG: hypothetical protein NTZ67_08790 [Gammaproteobacteria bacterium]|nr:hypothetical protein [Gammaproteobacteria bacterium]